MVVKQPTDDFMRPGIKSGIFFSLILAETPQLVSVMSFSFILTHCLIRSDNKTNS